MDEHAKIFLNQYAATTLVRYMTSVLQFVQLRQVMHVAQDLTEAQLADLLICGSLARHSDAKLCAGAVAIGNRTVCICIWIIDQFF
jgi:hypothetical protein